MQAERLTVALEIPIPVHQRDLDAPVEELAQDGDISAEYKIACLRERCNGTSTNLVITESPGSGLLTCAHAFREPSEVQRNPEIVLHFFRVQKPGGIFRREGTNSKARDIELVSLAHVRLFSFLSTHRRLELPV